MIPILAIVIDNQLVIPLYFFLCIALLSLSYLIIRLIKENAYRMIFLSLLIAAAAIGFGSFLSDPGVINTTVLLKISFIMALGGVATLLINREEKDAD